MRNYSQNNEQEIILNYFGDFKGRFLDIGAYNGVDISNTRALLELGWSGVLVEPNPFNLVDLINNCREFGDRAKIVAAGVGEHSQLRRLRLDDSPGRGWAASFIQDNPGVMMESPVQLYAPVMPISRMYDWGHFEFISIDAEWMDMEALTSFEINTLDHCQMLIIEPGGEADRQGMKNYLKHFGFRIHAETPENIIAAR